MKALLHDGTEMEIKAGQPLCGTRIVSFTLSFADVESLQDPRAMEWMRDVILTRLSPP